MVAVARPRLLGSTLTRLLVLAGVMTGFWLLLVLFGNASAKADSDVPAPKATHAGVSHVTKDLAATVTRTTDRAVRTVTEQTERLTRLSQPPVRAMVKKLTETTDRVRHADAMISSLVTKPVQAVVEAVRKPVRAIERLTDTHVSVKLALPVRGAAPRVTAVRPASVASVAFGHTLAAPVATATTRPAEHHVVTPDTEAARADGGAHPTRPAPAAPAPGPIGDGNAPGVNRGGTHDIPVASAPAQAATHRDHASVAPRPSTLPFDGAPAPRPGFSPD